MLVDVVDPQVPSLLPPTQGPRTPSVSLHRGRLPLLYVSQSSVALYAVDRVRQDHGPHLRVVSVRVQDTGVVAGRRTQVSLVVRVGRPAVHRVQTALSTDPSTPTFERILPGSHTGDPLPSQTTHL